MAPLLKQSTALVAWHPEDSRYFACGFCSLLISRRLFSLSSASRNTTR